MNAEPPRTLREVFEAHAPYVRRTLGCLGVAEADLDDLSQEVFVTVHQRMSGFRGDSSLRTWIYGICWHLTQNYRRAHAHRKASPPEGEEASPDPSPEALLAGRQTGARLRGLLDRLEENKRAVLVLYEIEELPMKEVAVVLGCPLQTAYSRLHAARRELVDAYRVLHQKENDR